MFIKNRSFVCKTSKYHFSWLKCTHTHTMKQAECRELLYEVYEAQCMSKVNLGVLKKMYGWCEGTSSTSIALQRKNMVLTNRGMSF